MPGSAPPTGGYSRSRPGIADVRGALGMGWHRDVSLGDYSLRVRVSWTGLLHRRVGHSPNGHDLLRLSGRHMRVAVRHRRWDATTQTERLDRLNLILVRWVVAVVTLSACLLVLAAAPGG